MPKNVVRNFLAIVDKAKSACENAGMAVADHFVDVSKMVTLGSGAKRSVGLRFETGVEIL